ncbi:MAG: hypothetical protein KDA42_07515 [Planctomycetales bacterium]|nr:hypothetical protein [Planctomycetales bacterium]
MFHYDRGLFLTKSRLALDVQRRQARGFVSHAHADHMGRHELALCTPATSVLYQHRCGRRAVLEMPYGEPTVWNDLRLTTFAAGHCLGSAMLLAEEGGTSLLYTGDFKLSPSATARQADPPRADILIMESTFGKPEYRLPPRDDSIDQLLALVNQALAAERAPVIHAYVLGKSQEVTRILTAAGIPVQQHPQIYEISRLYQSCGVELGSFHRYERNWIPGHAVVTPPRNSKAFRLPGLPSPVSIAVTGWAAHPSTKYRLRVDHAVALSDHADFDELVQLVDRVQPREIYCTHGPESFADHLCGLGWNARPLVPSPQKRLF